MDIALKIPSKINIVQETFLLRQSFEFEMFRPIQAWQWMVQSRSVPDQRDWVRPEVSDAWFRCLEEYHLPLGNFANWDKHLRHHTANDDMDAAEHVAQQIKHLSHHFQVFLKESGGMMVVVAPNSSLLYVAGEQQFPRAFQLPTQIRQTNWHESVLGNNGIGTALKLKAPVAFQGMEHYLSILHPYTTVGYPLLNESGELLAVIGLVSDHQEKMNSLFAFLHLICVLVNTSLPITRNQTAQVRVLKKIAFQPAKKIDETEYSSSVTKELTHLVDKAVKLQKHKIPILITGESGVGKDHFVNLMKNAGPRKDAPLIAINCASIPRELIESELFGYESGSFTGARSGGKPGKFSLANHGIIFLDEIGDMSIDLQSTLLRVLETSEFTPVGGTRPIHVDVQIVAATNVQLSEAVKAGRFRQDLYYRLNGAQIHLLPLRERTDKQQIIQHLLQREIKNIVGDNQVSICPKVIDLLNHHPWPGNIRQFINVVRATLYTAGDTHITQNDLPMDFMQEWNDTNASSVPQSLEIDSPVNTSSMSLADWEMHAIKTALNQYGGNISLTARKLGITRTTLYKKIDRFGLNKSPDSNILA
ncbi:sigma-54-dependent Fis family transcriptional regulator [Methyloprofundus sp.]|uniref:sigma-54-dependent Fis family transcriptional regulator n=1 Tax=Methyloprofundus sp. TaxID=2020875 RepID=UPI003D12EAD2